MLRNKEGRIKHYSNSDKILLVGEGDFSFSVCLAKAFGSAANMVATSLDSKEELVRKYSQAETNLKELEDRGCTVIHEVDAHTMSGHPLLLDEEFDRIIFNFPHATLVYKEHDFRQIQYHQLLVKGFLINAAEMLHSKGEVHVTHKKAHPFNKWEIGKLANEAGLISYRKVNFFTMDYPGYCNKRGQGSNCDDSFPVGESHTSRFKIWHYSRTWRNYY